ncbi:MarR family winged helix-turn-helix transcriptional regulator [Pontibacter arcticus]|uniref:MarR family transcriptional regulator n=1 Tax=Pontibacter arcticus TaxID=2080288 RepID=A0A364RG27_9BACT|nr:MarR family transcriptional regulator [Pontibacter arcticus]RAU83249.1 MarR family transcriptional regulator [Pontibacter arcticus]
MILENEIGLSSFRNERQKASISILYTYGFLANCYEQFYKMHGMTNQQYNALRILRDQYPKPVSTSFLREKMLDKMSDASRLVSRLSAKGLVVVTQNPTDKRLVNILISETGHQLISDIDSDLYKLDDLMNGITEEEAVQLTSLLYKVRNSLKSTYDNTVTEEQVHA